MLRRAPRDKHRGETVLPSRRSWRRTALQLTTEPVALQRAIAALRAAGLDGEARRLAREAAVADGL